MDAQRGDGTESPDGCHLLTNLPRQWTPWSRKGKEIHRCIESGELLRVAWPTAWNAGKLFEAGDEKDMHRGSKRRQTLDAC